MGHNGALKNVPGLWLDITRLASRAGRGALTGIDRVELAYLDAALGGEARFLCRTTRGYLLFDDNGARLLADMARTGDVPPRGDALSRLVGRGGRMRHRVEAAIRPHAIDRCLPVGLARLLGRNVAAQICYLNIGQSNLSERTLSPISMRSGARSVVMIHDLIPVTHPELAADGMPAAFAGRIDRVRRYADLVLCNSAVTSGDLERHWGDVPDAPRRHVVPLGVERPVLPEPMTRDALHFVMLGTIEPRKNHALMIETWEVLADTLPPEDMPSLHIIGSWGWKSDGLRARLEAHALMDKAIFVHNDCPDIAVQDHLARANALLFPSLAEGYGYPPLEAALAGAMPICSDLLVFGETLGQSAVYVTANDPYSWAETIKKQIHGNNAHPDLGGLKVATWDDHFKTVAAELARL